ncbi:MAG: PQQ-binding-like beta-propeller repeat protein, partial [Lentisphaeria bacterium]|nr:PQQ-binding-like beta-propeller repeat protein [Lentisphaeria bacterium]
SEAFRELETDALGDRAAELGQTVGADFFVAGNWGMVGTGEARGTFRLVRARDGLLVFAGDFSAPDPGELAAAVAARFAPLVVGSAAAQPTGVMHRLLEARALYRARDERRLRERAGYMWQWEKQKDGETAALTAPEDAAGIAETARHYLRLGQTDRALDFLRNRLAKTGNTGSFWEAAEPLAGILRARGETTSEVLLWQGLLEQTPTTDNNYGCMALLLAEVLAQQGRTEEALAWLERIVSPPQELGKEDFRMYRKGRLLEKLGHHREAAIAYTEDWWHNNWNVLPTVGFSRAWRPSLTAMIRLLGDPERSETHDIVRREILGWHFFPRQANQAARALLQAGCTDRETLWLAFLALLAEGDEEAARAAMQRLLTQGTGEITLRRHANFYVASQGFRRARVDAIGTALFAAAKLPTPLSEAEARERIAAAFGQAPPLPAAPAEPRTTVRPTDFIMPHLVTDALRRLEKGDTLLCLGGDRLWALVPDGSPLGAVAWSDQWYQGRGIPMGFGEAFGDICRASEGENGVVVVAAGGNGELRAYDVAKGTLLWQYTCWVPAYRPILRQGRAYVVTGARELLVLDLAKGELLERVPPPLEAEVFRPLPAGVRLMEDGRAIHHRGAATVHYSLESRSVATVQQPLPGRADQRPSLLDAFCGEGKVPASASAQRQPTKLDGLMVVFLDVGKPVRERLKESSKILEELKRAPDPAHKRALARLAADQTEEMIVRRSALGILNQLPDNPGAFLGIPLIRENEAFVEIGLIIMARESDAAWIEAVQVLKARPSTDWGRWQKIEELVTKGNLERTARDGFLAPEIGWDQTAVDRALGEFLTSRQANHPESCTLWYKVAAWTGSQHLPRLEEIVVGQVAGDRTTPIKVREGEPWTGTAREAVTMVRCLDMVHPAPRHIPILAAALRPSPDMTDWNLHTTQVLAGQQLFRIGTPEAIDTALASPQPLGTTDKEISRGLDLLEQASGRSFGTLPEWRLWWRTQNPAPPPGAP